MIKGGDIDIELVNDTNLRIDLDLKTGNLHIIPDSIVKTDLSYGTQIWKLRTDIKLELKNRDTCFKIVAGGKSGQGQADRLKNKKWLEVKINNNSYIINFEYVYIYDNKICAELNRVMFYSCGNFDSPNVKEKNKPNLFYTSYPYMPPQEMDFAAYNTYLNKLKNIRTVDAGLKSVDKDIFDPENRSYYKNLIKEIVERFILFINICEECKEKVK